MERPRGALVAKVLPGSPAEKAGFQVGDVVVKFDGKKIVKSSNLPPVVGMTPVGKDVGVNILRNGKVKELTVHLGELPDEDEKVASLEKPKISEDNKLNITVTDLTEEQRENLEIKENGVLVSGVSSGPARKAGVRRGDVILMINNADVKGTNHFKEIVEDLPPGKSVPLLVQRRGGPVFLALKLTDDK
jgi:serine protease Do